MSILDQKDLDTLLASASAGEVSPGQAHTERSSAAQSGSSPTTASHAARKAARIDSAELRRILHLRFPVIVTLAERKLPFEDLLKLTPGSIIEFDRASDSEPDLSIGNRKIGRGQAVKVGEYFGLRITTVHPVQDRIRAMGV